MSVSYYKGAEIPEMNYNITIDAKLQEKAIDITVNGSTVISPDSNYDALSGVTVNVNVPSSGGGESSGEGLNLKDIGYDYAVPDKFKEGMNYAKEIQEGWDSSIDSMTREFNKNTRLVFMPLVDTGNVTSMLECFSHCRSLTIIPLLNTGNVTSMSNCFYNCSSLTAIPELDFSNVTTMNRCFYGCANLTTIPELDTSNVTDMYGCFWLCYSLTSIPLLDTGNVTNMNECFDNCSSLTTIPELDFSNVTGMSNCFKGCSSLTTVPELNTEKVTQLNSCFENCSNLKRIEGISFKSMGSISSYYMFFFGFTANTFCRYLLIKDIGTKSACTTIDTTYARVWGINSEDVPDARQSLIDSLLTYSFDRASAGYSNCTIKLYSNVKALLTEDEITQIQAKGYVIS